MPRLAAIRAFCALSGSERRLFTEAWMRLPIAWLMLRTRFRSRCFRVQEPGREKPITPETIVRLVRAASGHHVRAFSCLEEAVVLARLLQRNGYPADVRIGVKAGEQGPLSHAWVDCGALKDASSIEYAVLSPAAVAGHKHAW